MQETAKTSSKLANELPENVMDKAGTVTRVGIVPKPFCDVRDINDSRYCP